MDLFGVSHGWGGAKRPPTWNLLHVFHNHETWHSYTLPKGDQKHRKHINHVTQPFCGNWFLSPEISKFCYMENYK